MSRALVAQGRAMSLALVLVAACASSPPAPERAAVPAPDAGMSDGGLARTEPPPAGAEPQGTPDAPFRAQPPPPSAPVGYTKALSNDLRRILYV